MRKQDWMTRITRRLSDRSTDVSGLRERAGRAMAPASPFEALEPRILLSGDHPGINEVFGPANSPPTIVTLDGNGQGVGLGQIGDVANDSGDFFQFTAAQDGFVSVLAQSFQAGLDSALELFLPSGTRISGTDEGLDNSTTARGLDTDGWLGFIAEAGQTYFLRVLGQNATTGSYALRINTANTTLSVNPTTGFARTGSANGQQQSIDTIQQDVIYTFTTPDLENFNSLGSILAGDISFGNDANGFFDPMTGQGRVDPLDTRLEFYDADGNLISSDADTGFLDDAFIVTRFERNTTYFVRVRSDAFVSTIEFDGELNGGLGANDDVSIGDFELRIQASGTAFPLDPVTRVGEVFRNPLDLNNPSPADFLRDNHSAQIFSFDSLGTGQTIINFFAFFQDPGTGARGRSWDPKIALYDAESLTPIATNDTAVSGDPFDRSEIVANLVGGQRYYVLVDAFDGLLQGITSVPRDLVAADNLYFMVIESNATIDRTDPDQPIDDHIDIDLDGDGTTVTNRDTVRDLATPLVWGTPFVPTGFNDPAVDLVDTDNDGNPDAFGDAGSGTRFPSVFDFPDPANDHSLVVRARASGRLDTAGDTDVFLFVPQVDHLGRFEGSLREDADGEEIDPALWNVNGRPASRISIRVDFTLEWLNLGPVAIQIYDSNFNLLSEDFANPLQSVNTDTVGPAGVESPSLLGPNPGDFRKVELATSLDLEYWGGEAYYLVVSSAGTRSRYDLAIQGDAQDDTFGVNSDAPVEGNFAGAVNTTLIFDNATGLGATTGNSNFVPENRQFLVESGIDPAEDPAGFFNLIDQNGQLGRITGINETDMYRFVAPRTGTAEILVSTTQITDAFLEQFINTGTGAVVSARTQTKTYDSPLDAAIRIYDSNGNQIAYINDFLGFTAEGTVIPFGNGGNPSVNDAIFFRKDPRIVINVQQGQEYFVVVESSQRYSDNAEAANINSRVAADPDTIDWRVATGSYKLIVNTTPESIADDHAGTFGGFQETVIPINSDPSSPANGTGSISGNLTQSDFDVFTFMAPVDGLMTITIDPSATLSLSIAIFDGAGTPIFLPNSQAIAGEPLTVSFAVDQAERYTFSVFGLSGTGTYSINLSGVPVADDLADQGRFFDAEPLDFGEFGRVGEASGVLNQGGDSDIFTFVAAETDLATLTVARQLGQAALTPAVIVYELGEDDYPTPNPVNHVIAWDFNPDGSGTVNIEFSTQQGRTYFIVVRGSNPSDSVGGYNLTVEFDPADDHADIGELIDATFVNIVPSTGQGSATGILEQSNDSDLFVFGVPTTGPTDLSLVWTPRTGATFEIRLFDINGTRIFANGIEATYSSASGFLAVPQFTGNTADIFYVAVVGPTATQINYTLSINTGIVDDHANDTNFSDATQIPLDVNTGNGSSAGRLEVDDDTDFFTFEVLDNGLFTVDVAQGNIGTLVFRLYDQNQNLVSPTQVDGNTISFTNTAGANARYFLSIGSTFPGIRTGNYSVSVDGPPVAAAPDDDHANQGNLAGATVLDVNTINADASDTGIIDTITDTDLFRYTTIGRGELFIQVFTPGSSSRDFTVRIFDANGVELTELANSTGVPGVPGITAATSFVASGPGQTFFILVDSTGDQDTGSYTLLVDGPALTTRTYYPEGFANAAIREFISLVNPNDEAVSYSITVYYADTNLGSAVVASGTLAAGARGGTTLSFGRDVTGDGVADFAPGIIANEAYSIVVESTLRLGASLSHYDANLARSGSIGEAFTDVAANRWDFPDVVRSPGVIEEFLVYFNPNPFDVNVTITAFTGSGSPIVLPVVTLGANRRGGLEIHNLAALPIGTFAIEITSAPVNSANNAANIGIVAAISRYDLVDRFAFGYLGVRDGGSTTNIITNLTNGTGISSEFTIFNPGSTAATVDIVGSFLEDPALPDLVRQVTVGAGQRLRLTGDFLAFPANEPLGLRITSNTSVAISSIERQRGDAGATTAFTEAGTSFYFGDAFINPARAGTLYTESLALYNPGTADTQVSITFFFADGAAERVRTETVAAQDFLLLRLENIAQVVQNRPLLNFFAIRIDSTEGIIASLTHFDGFLGGGWTTGGATIGLTSSIA